MPIMFTLRKMMDYAEAVRLALQETPLCQGCGKTRLSQANAAIGSCFACQRVAERTAFDAAIAVEIVDTATPDHEAALAAEARRNAQKYKRNKARRAAVREAMLNRLADRFGDDEFSTDEAAALLDLNPMSAGQFLNALRANGRVTRTERLTGPKGNLRMRFWSVIDG